MEGEAGSPKAGCSPVKSRNGCRVVSSVLTAGSEEGSLLTGPILQVHAGGEGVVNCLKEDEFDGEERKSRAADRMSWAPCRAVLIPDARWGRPGLPARGLVSLKAEKVGGSWRSTSILSRPVPRLRAVLSP